MWICPSCDAVALFQNEKPWPVDWRCMSCGRAVEHRCGVPCLAPELIGSRSGFDPGFFQDLLRIEAANFWFLNRGRLILRLLDEHFPASRSLLEIGCGTGSVLGAIQEHRPELCLIGSELHPEGIAIAGRRLGHGVTLLQFDARAIPAREEFDVVGAFDVIEHIPEDEMVLRAMRTCLRPGGGAIVTVPQHPWLWSPFDDAAHHCRRYGRGELEGKLRAAGFDVLRSTSYNALLLPLMLASRWFKKLPLGVSRRDTALSEFDIARWLNRTLSLTLTAETWMTTHGVNWPLGGSRFVVARRSPDRS